MSKAKSTRKGRRSATDKGTTAAVLPALTADERRIADKYGLEIKAGSLRYDEQLRKRVLVMFCAYCQQPRVIATQDAFQVRTCGSSQCRKAHKKAAK